MSRVGCSLRDVKLTCSPSTAPEVRLRLPFADYRARLTLSPSRSRSRFIRRDQLRHERLRLPVARYRFRGCPSRRHPEASYWPQAHPPRRSLQLRSCVLSTSLHRGAFLTSFGRNRSAPSSTRSSSPSLRELLPSTRSSRRSDFPSSPSTPPPPSCSMSPSSSSLDPLRRSFSLSR